MQTAQPQITTIIPTYKRPKLLKRTIESVLKQTYSALQVCVYDNASDDETKDVVGELAAKDSRVKYHAHTENIGSFQNFQFGLERVDTPFFSFISDDDLLLPWFYEKVIQALERNPEAAFFAGSLLYVTSEKKIVKVGIATQEEEILLPGSVVVERMLEGTFPLWTSVLFRKKVKEEIGLLDPDVGPFDFDFMLRAATRFSGVASHHMCALFYRHASSFSLAPELAFVWPGWRKVIEGFKREEKLPLKMHLDGEKKIYENVRRMLCLVVLTGLAKKNFAEAKEAAVLLQELHNHKALKMAFFLLIGLCARHDFLRKSFAFLLKTSLGLRDSMRKSRWQKRYGNHLQYLD